MGRRLADRLWIKYADVDENICKKSGKTIKAMFEEDGEPHFRTIETQVVQELTSVQEQVISLGGGTKRIGIHRAHLDGLVMVR